MPFTPSHAAAVLPLFGRGGLVPAALVIGSMAPDLPYYLLLGTETSLTHSALGIVTVDLAMGFAVLVLWQGWVAPATYAASPRVVRARAHPPASLADRLGTPHALALVVASLILGGITHVLWDDFTHEGHWGTNAIPWLTEEHGPLAGYRWAQYASSALGLAAVSISLAVWWRRTTPTTPGRGVPHRDAVAFWGAIAAALAVGLAAGILSGVAGEVGLRRGVFRALVWSGGLAMFTALVGSAVVARELSRPAG